MSIPLAWITWMTESSRRVLIIDGHPAVGRGLEALVGGMPGLTVVGLASLVACGLRQALRTPPDVALVDADLPGLCSLAAIALLKARIPRTRIVALGIYPHRRRLALAAGADEFVLKDAGYEALRAAIEGTAGDSMEGGAAGEERPVPASGMRERVAS